MCSYEDLGSYSFIPLIIPFTISKEKATPWYKMQDLEDKVRPRMITCMNSSRVFVLDHQKAKSYKHLFINLFYKSMLNFDGFGCMRVHIIF